MKASEALELAETHSKLNVLHSKIMEYIVNSAKTGETRVIYYLSNQQMRMFWELRKRLQADGYAVMRCRSPGCIAIDWSKK